MKKTFACFLKITRLQQAFFAVLFMKNVKKNPDLRRSIMKENDQLYFVAASAFLFQTSLHFRDYSATNKITRALFLK